MIQTTHLEIGAENSQQFLRIWATWRANPRRSCMLHVVAICPAAYRNPTIVGSETNSLKPLAALLDAQLWGLLPGFHRLVFDGGHVLLTLCIGDVAKLLRQQRFEADTIQLNSPSLAAEQCVYAAKAIARLSKTGTLLTMPTDCAMQAALIQCGFVFDAFPGERKATFDPSWRAKKRNHIVTPGRCVVVGAGLSGAAVASSLARRGWTVTVLDTGSEPAAGASSLPAGLLVPHTSPDDSQLSRLSRAGARITLQQARDLLSHGTDWGHTGVLQCDLEGAGLRLPRAWGESSIQAASDWCRPASANALAAANLPPDVGALWHLQAGWMKPAALVKAWLGSPGIAWRGGVEVRQIKPSPGGWQVCDTFGQVAAQGELVVLSAGYSSQSLAFSAGADPPDLQAVRGQVTWGFHEESSTLPPFAVNGHGSLITAITTPDGPMWLMGASYERDVQQPFVKPQDHTANLVRLQTLLPVSAVALAHQFDPPRARGWAGVRCMTPNRLPMVGPAATADSKPGLWLCTGMGSRGLSFAALCAELLAAQLHGEPLPIDDRSAIKLNKFKRSKLLNQ